MATTKVQIANMALNGLRVGTIASFSDGTNSAKAVDVCYEQVKQKVINQGHWTACRKRATLSQLVAAPAFGFAYQYQLPSDCLKPIKFNDQELYDIEYVIEGRLLLTDESSVKLLYLFDNNDPQTYGPDLTAAIVSALKAELTFTLTGSATTERNNREQAELDKLDGLASDGQAGSIPIIRSDSWKDVR